MILDTQELASACEIFARHDYVTVDTEFLRETTFWPQLCLIQMSGPDLDAIVDPLAPGLDLAPFFKLMADASVTKVFHAARQDIEIIFNRGGLIPHPIFDTQVAAMVCGFGDSVSYDTLVQRICSEQLDKSSRFTDWSHRPLSAKQLDYAMADVTHLRQVYLHLKTELEREGRTEWLAEEMAVLESRETYDIHPDDAWQRLRMRIRKPIELAILQKLAAWREREARARDVPRGRVLKDDAIFEIAQQQPKDTEALGRLRTIPKGYERSQHGAAILGAVNAALAIEKADLPKVPRAPALPEGNGAAVEMLKVLLKLIAEKNGVAAKIIASSEDLDLIASKGEEANVGALRGWRRELFGEPAIRLIQGEMALRFVNRKVDVVSLPTAAEEVA
ncbi:MAG: ribonuclease D [Rhizobium sp.]|nr:ribonuclease D [Rhizobium sp.]